MNRRLAESMSEFHSFSFFLSPCPRTHNISELCVRTLEKEREKKMTKNFVLARHLSKDVDWAARSLRDKVLWLSSYIFLSHILGIKRNCPCPRMWWERKRNLTAAGQFFVIDARIKFLLFLFSFVFRASWLKELGAAYFSLTSLCGLAYSLFVC